MDDGGVAHTVLLDEPAVEDSQWEMDRRAFWEMRESLLPRYRGKYVAVYRGEGVDDDDDRIALTDRVYRCYGYVPVYCQLVTDGPLPVHRVSSPRVLQR